MTRRKVTFSDVASRSISVGVHFMRRALSLTALVTVVCITPGFAQDIDYPSEFDEAMPLHHDGKGLGPFSRSITTDSVRASGVPPGSSSSAVNVARSLGGKKMTGT